jgi:hypothetical protein
VSHLRNGAARDADSRTVSESGRSTTEESRASTTPPGGADDPAGRPAERTTYLRVRPSPRPRTTPTADARDTSAVGAGVEPVEEGEASAPQAPTGAQPEDPAEANGEAVEVGVPDPADAHAAGEGVEVRSAAETVEDPTAAMPTAAEDAQQTSGAVPAEQPTADPATAEPAATAIAGNAPVAEAVTTDEGAEAVTTDEGGARPTPVRVVRATPHSPGPSTKVLQPVAVTPAPATIPALPIAPVDPADRPFAHPQRSVPGKPDTVLRRIFRRRRG